MKKLVLLPALCLLCLFGGCATTLEDTAVIKAMAFDVAGDQIELTACVLNAEGQEAYEAVSVKEDTMAGALTALSRSMERRPFLGQNDVLIFSKAFCERGIGDVVEYLFYNKEASGGELVCMVKGEAKEAFSYTEQMEKALDISRNLENAEQYGGMVSTTLHDVENATRGIANSCVVPVAEISEEQFAVMGAAVLKGFQLDCLLSDMETMGTRLVYAEDGTYTLPLGEYGVQVKDVHTKITQEDRVFHTVIYCTYSVQADNGRDMREEIEAYMEQCVRSAFIKARQADFLGLAQVAQKNDLQAMQQMEDWQETLAGMEMAASVHAKQSGSGYPPKGVFD